MVVSLFGLVSLLAARGFLQVGFRPTTVIGFSLKLNPVKGFRNSGARGVRAWQLDSGKVLLLLLVAGALAWRQDAIRSVLQLEIKPGMVLAFSF